MTWEEVVTMPENKYEIAVGTTSYRINGKDVRVDVIKPRHGEPYVTFKDSGIKLTPQPQRREVRELVDSISRWRPWSR